MVLEFVIECLEGSVGVLGKVVFYFCWFRLWFIKNNKNEFLKCYSFVRN